MSCRLLIKSSTIYNSLAQSVTNQLQHKHTSYIHNRKISTRYSKVRNCSDSLFRGLLPRIPTPSKTSPSTVRLNLRGNPGSLRVSEIDHGAKDCSVEAIGENCNMWALPFVSCFGQVTVS